VPPVFDPQSNLSIGALAVDPADHSIWVGTGEPNTSQDSYGGNGVFRSTDYGKTWQLVGNALPGYLIYQLTFDGAGNVYATTSRGLLKRNAPPT
jgi:ligand-binding sensor domain-containing protein